MIRTTCEQSSDLLTIPGGRRRPSVPGVPSFLVETYLARTGEPRGPGADATQARIDLVIWVPTDEICFYVLDAPTASAAARAAERAGLDPIRVVEAVTHIWKESS